MRSTVLTAARSCLVAVLVGGLLNIPAVGAPAKPLGMIVGAENASLDKDNAVRGSGIFAGDDLATYEKGSMRFQVGGSQLYMFASSAARLAQHDSMAQVAIDRGTIGFSAPASGQLEIATPLGILRSANGSPFSGQVAVLDSGKMRVSAFKGSFVVNTNGQEQTIAEGQTWQATLSPSANAGGGNSSNPPQVGVGSNGVNWTRVAILAAIAGGAFIAACETWPESPSGTGCW